MSPSRWPLCPFHHYRTRSWLVYGIPLSGHVHRVRLFLSILKLDYSFVEASMQSSEVLKLNPLGQIPILEDGDIILTDSNAILVYLAKTYASDSSWLPEDALGTARVQKWFSIAAGELRYGPAMARAATLWKRPDDIASAQVKAAKLLPFMNDELKQRPFLAGDMPTLAYLSCYAYIKRVPEGEVSLVPYSAVQQWLECIEALPDFIPMPEASAFGL
ncbi:MULTISPECIES: glutathione S-transferase family protein [Gluconobacter]|uniref:glutathione S-transferase family protein n=1 Tax=Gluconobacter TaxID=441 RepID=UPI000A3B6D12|nr:glutathione S-transferase N-terminal domain-containing protein [Gluconobacter sp. DsW_058]MBS1036220.1 glutathione S-transferase N-terminal domain-containing protein [Gluconobacter cerinus]